MRNYPIIIALFILTGFQTTNAQSIAYSLANPSIEVMGIDTFYEVDVMIATQNPGETFFMSSGQLYFNYNIAAFGPNVAGNNRIEVLFDMPGYLLNLKETEFNLLNVYQLLPINDNTMSRVSVPWGQDRAGNCISQAITDIPAPLFRLRLQFAPNGSDQSPDVCFESLDLFANQTYTRCGPLAGMCSAVTPADCTNEPGTQIFGDEFFCNISCGISGIPFTSASSTTVCLEPGGQWVHLENDNGEVIVSVNSNGDDLGLIDAEVFVDPVVSEVNGDAFLQRHYRVNSTNPVSGITNLRLYFTAAELSNLITAALATPTPFDNITTADDLAVTKYNGPTEDGIFDPSDATSLEYLIPVSRGLVFGENYIEIQVTSFSEFWIHGLNTGLLPIELITFSGKKTNDGSLLEWQTATEINSGQFEIERSGNNQHFEKIGVVEAAGNTSNPQAYHFVDSSPFPGRNYYRLKMVDLDESFTYSEVVLLKYEQVTGFSIRPNPVSEEHLSFSVISPFSEEIRAEIIDVRGRVVVSEIIDLSGNQTWYTIPVRLLPSGVYHLKISKGEHFAVEKFIKLE